MNITNKTLLCLDIDILNMSVQILSTDQEDALDSVLNEIIFGSVQNVQVSTKESAHEYTITLREITNQPRMRTIKLHLKWHPEKNGWELLNRTNGTWRS